MWIKVPPHLIEFVEGMELNGVWKGRIHWSNGVGPKLALGFVGSFFDCQCWEMNIKNDSQNSSLAVSQQSICSIGCLGCVCFACDGCVLGETYFDGLGL